MWWVKLSLYSNVLLHPTFEIFSPLHCVEPYIYSVTAAVFSGQCLLLQTGGAKKNRAQELKIERARPTELHGNGG